MRENKRYYVSDEELAELRARQREPEIADVHAVLSFFAQQDIPVWLHGGWAVEALLGKPLGHRDIDLFVCELECSRLRKILGRHLVVENGPILFCEFDLVEVDIAVCQPYRAGYWFYEYGGVYWILPDLRTAGIRATLGEREVPLADPRIIYAEQDHKVRKKKNSIPKMDQRAAWLREKLDPRLVAESRRWWPKPVTRWNRLLMRLRRL